MAAQWHYQHGGQQHGPITATDLKALAARGGLLPDNLIWKKGMAKWVPARGVKGLFPDGAAKPVVAAPVPARAVGGGPPPLPPPLPDEDDDENDPKPRRTGRRAKLAIAGGAGAILPFLILMPVLLLSGGRSSSGGGSTGGTNAAISARDVLKQFIEDRMTAEGKYLGKAVTLTGVLNYVDNTDGTHIDIETGSVIGSINCKFSLKYGQDLKSLGKGKEITFRGTCSEYRTGPDGKFGFLEFVDCELVGDSGKNGEGNKTGLPEFFVLPDGSRVRTANARIDEKAMAFLKAGMTRQEVTSLLGQPDDKKIDDPNLELWGYRKGKTTVVCYASQGQFSGRVASLHVDDKIMFVGDLDYRSRGGVRP